LIDEPQKEVSDLESEQDSKDAKVNALDLKLIGDSFKENNNKDNVNHEIHKPKIEEIIKTEPQNVNKNNLLFNLFNK